MEESAKLEEGANTVNKKLLGAIGVCILLFVVGIFFLSYSRKSAISTMPVEPQGVAVPSVQTQQPQQKAYPSIIIPTGKTTIMLTPNGFDPQTLTVQTKTQVVWTNNSGADASVNSADHPTHRLYPPLNLGLFHNGQNLSLNFNTPGTYRYHDHLHPERTGTVIVVEKN